MDDLAALCYESKPDFVVINEVWSNGDFDDVFFKLPGFEIICRKDRVDTTEGIGGGLLIYTSLTVTGKVFEFCNEEIESFNQCLAIKIPLKGKSDVVLVLLYRPHHIYEDTIILPDETACNNSKLCRLLYSIPKPYVVIGDLNFSQIDWSTMSSDASCKDFVDAVQDNFLTQHIDFPTHMSGTQPDVILSSREDIIVDVEEICNLGSSDHSMVMLTMAGSIPSNTTFEEVPDWRNADLTLLRNELMAVDWVHELENCNVLESWDFVKSAILDAEEKCVPKKRRRISSRPIWMQQNIIRTIRKKRRLWKTYIKSKDYEEYLAYKKVEKETRSLVRKAKKKFERKLAREAKRKPKLFYSYLRSKTSNKQSVGPLKDGDTVVSDNAGMANLLNKFLASVFTTEGPIIHEPVVMGVTEKLLDVDINTDVIAKKIQALKPAAAPGPDKICPRILMENVDILCTPLSIVFLRSIDEGVVPEDWRKANVTPIFKSGSKMSPGTYRPVSLTCIICKILESIIKDSMVSHLTSYNLIRSSQHGFTASESYQNNLHTTMRIKKTATQK